MRTFVFALAAIVPASCVIGQAGAADRLPDFDIARNCHEEVAGGINSIAACSKDETDAKTSWPKAGLSLAHQIRKPALAGVPLGASRAMSSF